MSVISDERIEELLAKEAVFEDEIARLRRDLEIWRRNGGDILREAEIKRLRAALEQALEAHNYAEILEIIRKALAKEGK